MTAIKKRINLIFDVTTKTKWKREIEKKSQKYKIAIWPNPIRMFIKPSRYIITENQKLLQ